MTAIRNTILAIVTMSLALAAELSWAADAAVSGAGYNPVCQAYYPAGYGQDAAYYPGGNPGFQPQDSGGDPNSGSATADPGMERDPVFPELACRLQDLRERCDGCCWRVDASALYLHRPDPMALRC